MKSAPSGAKIWNGHILHQVKRSGGEVMSNRKMFDKLARSNREAMDKFTASFAGESKPKPEYYVNSSGKRVRRKK